MGDKSFRIDRVRAKIHINKYRADPRACLLGNRVPWPHALSGKTHMEVVKL